MKVRVLSLLLFPLGVELPAQTTDRQQSASATFRVESLVTGLSQPVAIAFLPDGRALVAERTNGRLSLWNPGSSSMTALDGMPPIVTGEDTGLLDVLPHPEFRQNGWIYISYGGGTLERSTTVVDRFRLRGNRVAELERIFTADAYSEDLVHYGGRLALRDGYLFVTVGDRHHQDRAQELFNHTGTIVRLYEDGRVPPDNPFVGQDSVLPEIWSYGHRNPQGLVFHPVTGELWSHEHGPLGGDELNLIRKGANYGWPEISYGWEYSGGPIGKGIVAQDSMQQPAWVWTPAISPSGLIIYNGSAFPGWRGSWLSGSMGRRHINRVVMREGRVILEERLILRQWGRIRCVAEGPDGFVYFCSDESGILRLRPE